MRFPFFPFMLFHGLFGAEIIRFLQECTKYRTFQPLEPCASPNTHGIPPYEEAYKSCLQAQSSKLYAGETLTEEHFILQFPGHHELLEHIAFIFDHENGRLFDAQIKLNYENIAFGRLLEETRLYEGLEYGEYLKKVATDTFHRCKFWDSIIHEIMEACGRRQHLLEEILQHRHIKSFTYKACSDWKQIHEMTILESNSFESRPLVTVIDSFDASSADKHGQTVAAVLQDAAPSSVFSLLDHSVLTAKYHLRSTPTTKIGGSFSLQMNPFNIVNMKYTLNFFREMLPYVTYKVERTFDNMLITKPIDLEPFGPIVNMSYIEYEDDWKHREDSSVFGLIQPILRYFVQTEIILAGKLLVVAAGNMSMEISSTLHSFCFARACCELSWTRDHIIAVVNLREDGLRPNAESCQPGNSLLVNSRYISAIGHSNIPGFPGVGTSIAVPRVSGAAACLMTLFPCLTPAQAAQILLDSATPIVILPHEERVFGKPVALNCMAKDFYPNVVYKRTSSTGTELEIYVDEEMWMRSRSKYGMGRLNLKSAIEYAQASIRELNLDC